MIELNSDLEEVIRERALRWGLPLGEYLREVIEVAEPELASRRSARLDARPEQWVSAFRSWAADHPIDTPLLSDTDVRREAIYEDRE